MAQPDHPSNSVAVASVARLLSQGDTAHFTHQNISEFWNVATRPVDKNGLGLSVKFVLTEVHALERILTLLSDTPTIYTEWKHLVVKHAVLGSKVHDARLVAAMRVHGVGHILTFNTSDFARYEVVALNPQTFFAS
jgi:predicted nucleic acid-binding protein